MRRALAFILAAVFSFELIAPALFASTATELPSCCRRGGKHHCAMAGMDGAGPVLNTLESKCPFFPKTEALLKNSQTVLLHVAPSFGAPSFVVSAIDKTDDNRCRIALRGPVRKRGPPLSLD